MPVEQFYSEEFYRVTTARHSYDVEYIKEVFELKSARDGSETPRTLTEESVIISDNRYVYFRTTKTDGKSNKKQPKLKKTKTIDKKAIEEFKKLPEHVRNVIGI